MTPLVQIFLSMACMPILQCAWFESIWNVPNLQCMQAAHKPTSYQTRNGTRYLTHNGMHWHSMVSTTWHTMAHNGTHCMHANVCGWRTCEISNACVCMHMAHMLAHIDIHCMCAKSPVHACAHACNTQWSNSHYMHIRMFPCKIVKALLHPYSKPYSGLNVAKVVFSCWG